MMCFLTAFFSKITFSANSLCAVFPFAVIYNFDNKATSKNQDFQAYLSLNDKMLLN